MSTTGFSLLTQALANALPTRQQSTTEEEKPVVILAPLPTLPMPIPPASDVFEAPHEIAQKARRTPPKGSTFVVGTPPEVLEHRRSWLRKVEQWADKFEKLQFARFQALHGTSQEPAAPPSAVTGPGSVTTPERSE